MNIRFIKMHGLGNDFILIDCLSKECEARFPVYKNRQEGGYHSLSDLAKKLCHRRFGIGADQLLLLFDSDIADFRMIIFNADGSEVEMCGNGIRCLAKYIWDRKLADKSILSIETLAGIIKPEKSDDMVRVDMGEPVFEPERIPVNIHIKKSTVNSHQSLDENIDRWPLTSDKGLRSSSISHQSMIIDYPLQIADREFKITCVSMGNPHTVIFIEDSADFSVAYYGAQIETHPLFPRRTNVEFVQILNNKEIRMRVWERGAGETAACGTGASAAAVASSIKGLTGRSVTVHLSGGDLFIDWAGDNHVYMTGPAVEVYEGSIEV